MSLNNIKIDHDILSRVLDALDLIKLFRIVAERGIQFDNIGEDILEEDSVFERRVNLLPDYLCIFDEKVEEVYVNDHSWEGAKFFEEVTEYFIPEETLVSGIIFHSKDIMQYYNMCKEKGINIQYTPFADYIYNGNGTVNAYGDGYTYLEIFIPEDKVIEALQAPLMLFYTDGTLFNSSLLEYYYQALDHVKAVINGEEELLERR